MATPRTVPEPGAAVVGRRAHLRRTPGGVPGVSPGADSGPRRGHPDATTCGGGDARSMVALTSSLSQQVRSQGFMPVESTIPVDMTIEQWRRRRVTPRGHRISRLMLLRFR